MANIQPTHNITAAQAMDLINQGLPIVDAYVQGAIKITDGDFNKEITFINCIIESFESVGIEFQKHIKFTNTHFKDCKFSFSYFLDGLTIENCVFDNYLDFFAGGHNQPSHTILLTKNSFSDYVNFFDCWFMSEVVIVENKFIKGTNIESKESLITFDTPPIISNNIGQMDLQEINPY